MKKQKIVLFFLIVMAVITITTTVKSAPEDSLDEFYGARGEEMNREYSSLMPNEQVDPFNGNLMLKYTLLDLPQNGGWNLKVLLNYNSNFFKKQNFISFYEDSWIGVGWSLHFGRLIDPIPMGKNINLEMADGSSHPLYLTGTNIWKTKDNWMLTLDSGTSTYTLTLDDGMKYIFEDKGVFVETTKCYSVSKIVDVYGNTVNIYYGNSNVKTGLLPTQTASRGFITYVIDSVGRRIDFDFYPSTSGASMLRYIRCENKRWQFDYHQIPMNAPDPEKTIVVQYKLLTGLTLTNLNFKFQFKYWVTPNCYALKSFVSPHGVQVNYTYGTKGITDPLGKSISYKVVTTKEVVGIGSWVYEYSNNTTRIRYPESKDELYTFIGYPNTPYWRTGLIEKKQTYNKSGTLVQEELYEWNGWAVGSNLYRIGHYDSTIYKPVLQKKTTKLGTRSYVIEYSNFSAQGHPGTITETGQLSRTTQLTYWTNSSLNIIDARIASKTVSSSGQSYTNSHLYETKGKISSENLSGVVTTYLYASDGNLARTTDANGHWKEFSSYRYGVPQIINYNNKKIVTREIDYWGNVVSTKDQRNKPTTFTFDYLGRTTKIIPPVGAPTIITYATTGSYISKSRGNHTEYQLFDVLGRNTGRYNPAYGSVKDMTYDSLGRKVYESYVYSGSKSVSERSIPSLTQEQYPVENPSPGPGEDPPAPNPQTFPLTASNITRTSVDLSWPYDENKPDIKYQIRMTQGTQHTIASVSDGFHRWTGLSPNTSYIFAIRAFVNGHANDPVGTYNTGYVNAITIKTSLSLPTTVNLKMRERGTDYIVLVWDAVTDPSLGIKIGYTDSSGDPPVGASTGPMECNTTPGEEEDPVNWCCGNCKSFTNLSRGKTYMFAAYIYERLNVNNNTGWIDKIPISTLYELKLDPQQASCSKNYYTNKCDYTVTWTNLGPSYGYRVIYKRDSFNTVNQGVDGTVWQKSGIPCYQTITIEAWALVLKQTATLTIGCQ